MRSHLNKTNAWMLVVGLAALLAACQDSTTPPAEPTEQPAGEQLETAQQALTDPAGPNYLAIGGPFADLLDEAGEPDAPAARLVNGGNGITAGSANEFGWVVVGPTGTLTFLDDDGRPKLGQLRDVIENKRVDFIALGERRVTNDTTQSAWLVGGEDGRVQFINQQGEPETQLVAQVYTSGEAVTAGAYSVGAEQWFIGNDAGFVTSLNNELTVVTNDGVTFGGDAISALTANTDTASAVRVFAAAGAKGAYLPGGTSFEFADGAVVSAASSADGKLVIGTADGRVAMADFEAMTESPTWLDALDGAAVNEIIYNGTEWLILGDLGRARLLGSDGQLVGEVAELGSAASLETAQWAKDRWLVGTSDSLVLDVSPTLELNLDYQRPLGDADATDATTAKEIALVVGEGGKYAIVTDRGESMSGVKSIPSGADLHTAAWSGTTFIIGGVGGEAYIVDEAGELVSDKLELLDGRDIHTAAWSGNVWLVAGEEGYVQRVRPDGAIVAQAEQLDGFERINHARWSGLEWIVVGTNTGKGAFRLINGDGTPKIDTGDLNGIPNVLAAEWNGREWLVGGTDGFVQVVSAAGVPRTMAGSLVPVLAGSDIHSIEFHGGQYLVAGDRGLVRIVNNNLQSPAPPVVAAGFERVVAARWTRPRGFGQGECLTSERCYVGECIGGSIQAGFCCDSSCDQPCESCVGSETGGEDGVCAPLPADAEPVQGSCEAADASTCGLTGLCDGAGECALFGADVECQPSACSDGAVSPAGLCDGEGACVVAESSPCAPYVGCDGDACATVCSSADDCVEGYICDAGECVVEPEEMPEPEPEPEPEGCCAVVRPPHVPTPLGLLVIGLIGLLRRRRA